MSWTNHVARAVLVVFHCQLSVREVGMVRGRSASVDIFYTVCARFTGAAAQHPPHASLVRGNAFISAITSDSLIRFWVLQRHAINPTDLPITWMNRDKAHNVV